MNGHYLHLVSNHLPLGALLFGFAIFLLGLIRRSDTYERIGLGLLVAAALLAIPVLLSGEGAEEVVEELAGFTRADHRLIHEHEEAAEFAFWWTQIVGVVALLGLYTKGPFQKVYRIQRYVLVVVGLFALTSTAVTARHGGQIRRPELREGYVAPAETEGQRGGEAKDTTKSAPAAAESDEDRD
jgi:uncharacterized membrane protein